MSSPTLTPTATTSSSASASKLLTVVTAAAVLGALGSAGYMSGVIFLTDTNAEAHSAPVTIVECFVAAIGFMLLAVTVPSLASVSRLPRWAVTAAAAGCLFVVVQAWTYATLLADMATRLDSATFDELGQQPTLLFEMFYRPLGVVALFGFVSLAVAGWRRKAFSRGASVLLVLAGLAALLGPFPPAGLLAGIGLAWAARTIRS